MRAVPDGDLFVPAEAATHAFDAVGDHCLAVARATEHDAALVFSLGHRHGDRTDEIRVIAGGVRVGAHVADGVSVGEERGDEGCLIGETRVIGADGDGKGLHGKIKKENPKEAKGLYLRQ